MSHRRQFAVWIGLTVVAIGVFLAILRQQYQPTQQRFALAVAPKPAVGRDIFDAKGCAKCHGAGGIGAAAPSLRERASLQSLPRLVTAVWNHVPRMSEAIDKSGMEYPAMSNEEMAQLVAYLYITGITDQPGNAERGRVLFAEKSCANCHGANGSSAPAVHDLGRADSPLALTETLWNHASGMSQELERRKMQWPTLKAGELRDIFAYIEVADGKQASAVRTGDPAHGWEVFQAKSCMECHTLAGRQPTPSARSGQALATSARVGHAELKTVAMRPKALGADGTLPPTLAQFGEAMLNHFPEMRRVMADSAKTPPSFAPGEFTDVAVFLYGLRYSEPTGSPHIGASVFEWRGCAACHGKDASGGSAPALRGRGQSYTAVRLATGLWRHGAKMYEVTQRTHQAWPELQESDVGDLLAFLNTPVEKK